MCAVTEAVLQQVRQQSSYQSDLKTILADLVPKKQAEVKEFRSQHGSKVVGEVTVDMVSTYIFKGRNGGNETIIFRATKVEYCIEN